MSERKTNFQTVNSAVERYLLDANFGKGLLIIGSDDELTHVIKDNPLRSMVQSVTAGSPSTVKQLAQGIIGTFGRTPRPATDSVTWEMAFSLLRLHPAVLHIDGLHRVTGRNGGPADVAEILRYGLRNHWVGFIASCDPAYAARLFQDAQFHRLVQVVHGNNGAKQ
jgi:hypothetical protein